MAPTLAGFLTFLRGTVGIDPLNLPDDEATIQVAFDLACHQVNRDLARIGAYALAVYNLAADHVINYAPDQANRDYFSKARVKLGIDVFVPGVLSSSGNGPTSESMLTPDFMKGMTLGNLQNLKTPYGRRYLALAQSVGSLWGMS